MAKWTLPSFALTLVICPVFMYALWLRTTSLEVMPEVNGDEVWHAVQLTHLMRGEPYSLLTVSSLPLSPIHAALESPFLLLCKPSLWVVRLPALMTGIAAVILVYVLGSRMLGRSTAIIASALLAVTPIAIIFSRVSYESSHAPLYGILILYFAYRLNIIAVVIMLLASYFVHPTNIFLLPLLVAVVFVRSLEECPEDPVRGRRRMLARVAAMTAVVLGIGILAMMSPDTKRLSKALDTGIWGRHVFLEFCTNYERLLLGCHTHSAPLRSTLFWTCMIMLLSFGLWRLVSSRQWDRVAFVVGSIASALALFVMGGSNIIMPAAARYGLFLVTPTCLAVACLVNSLLVSREAGRSAWPRYLQYGGILGIGWILLLSVDLTHITMWSFIAPKYYTPKESPWTFDSDVLPPLRQVRDLILRDIEAKARRFPTRPGERPRVPDQTTLVLTHGWWESGPLEWLTISRRDIKFSNLDLLPNVEGIHIKTVKDCLDQGGYIVGFTSSPGLHNAIKVMVPAESLQHWDILHGDGRPSCTVYRKKWDVPSRVASRANDAVGPGSTKPLGIESSTAIIR